MTIVIFFFFLTKARTIFLDVFFSNTHHSFTPAITSCHIPKASDVEQQKQWQCRWRLPLSVHRLLQSLVISDFGQPWMSKGPVWDGTHCLLTPFHFRNKLTSDGVRRSRTWKAGTLAVNPKTAAPDCFLSFNEVHKLKKNCFFGSYKTFYCSLWRIWH